MQETAGGRLEHERLRKALYTGRLDVRQKAAAGLARIYGRDNMNCPAGLMEVDRLLGADAAGRIDALKNLAETAVNPYENSYERDISFAVPALALALEDGSREIRRESLALLTVCLGQWDISDALPGIMAVLGDPGRTDMHEKTAQLVEKAITRHRYGGASCRTGLETALSADNAAVRTSAARSLVFHFADTGDWEAVRVLLLQNDVPVRSEAAAILADPYLKDTKPVFPVLVNLLSDKDPEVRLAAARTLALKGGERAMVEPAVKTLLALAGDKNHPLETRACKALGESIEYNVSCAWGLKKKDWPLFAPAALLLDTRLRARDKSPEFKTVRFLTRYYSHTGGFSRIEELLHTGSAVTRRNLIIGLSGCDDDNSCRVDFSPLLPALLAAYAGDRDEAVRNAAKQVLESYCRRSRSLSEALLHSARESGLDVNALKDFMKAVSDTLNRRELTILKKEAAKAKGPARVKSLLAGLRDPRAFARAFAASSLCDISHPGMADALDITEALPELTARLKDDDMSVRLYAAGALGNIAHGEAGVAFLTPPAFTALLSLLGDPLNDIRKAALRALENAVKLRDIPRKTASTVSGVLLHDAEKDVRFRAASFYFEAARAGRLAEDPGGALLNGLSDEYDLVRTMCARTLARYLMTPKLAEKILKVISSKKIKKQAAIRELMAACSKALKS